MTVRERINPKTNQKQYKARYYFRENGKRTDSETSWFETKEQAEKEAERLKAQREQMDLLRQVERRDKRLITMYVEYMEECRRKSEKQEKTTDVQYYRTVKTIYKYHIPPKIQNVKLSDITPIVFRNWLAEINKKENVGGKYIRQIKNVLVKFNDYLEENGCYVDMYMSESIYATLSRAKLKNTKVNDREENGERHIISVVDIESITSYYADKGLGNFRNFYYYTLFYLLFYSGIRVEELVGLQWKFIDLRDNVRSISIKNSIVATLEKEEYVLKRVKKEKYKTKNKTSCRVIPIFDFYYDLLKDYKESYRYEYGLSKEEVENGFVFPRLKQHDPYLYLNSIYLLRELNKTTKELGIPKTDLQMFRHSCATFLILPYPDGLGYTEEKVKDYFGHQDTKMLNSVYGKLNTMQKADRMRKTFMDIYNPTNTGEKSAEELMRERLIKRVYGDNEMEKEEARRKRILEQIKYAERKLKQKYYYSTKDKDIIEEYIKNNNSIMEFIEES